MISSLASPFSLPPTASAWDSSRPWSCASRSPQDNKRSELLSLLRSKRYAYGNITLLRTLAGPGRTGYDRCLHVSIVARIVRRRGIEFVVIVAVEVEVYCSS